MIDLAACIEQSEQQARAIQAMVAGVDEEQARWKPDADSWSILEVVNHLADEEREDFRTRLKHILGKADGLPPGIDPVGWVTARQYNARNLRTSLEDFMRERDQSLAWLSGLSDPEWDHAIEAPFGQIRAGDMLMSWLAHDLLHLRQLVELRYAYHRQQALPDQIQYAGKW